MNRFVGSSTRGFGRDRGSLRSLSRARCASSVAHAADPQNGNGKGFKPSAINVRHDQHVTAADWPPQGGGVTLSPAASVVVALGGLISLLYALWSLFVFFVTCVTNNLATKSDINELKTDIKGLSAKLDNVRW